ncbi:hypothetical protein [Stenotrophomonas sp. S39]|uniref:hypothetical protein n=1 Tax=Stenotrophomonas sp. S39 TaxID=2767451 RepID=UPI00190AAFEB|nr:hypothetical protein [Stenotrophomonas sp. S39]MBK0053080.1 hypothetical protein [Stenotrophomonas sp. S39]
MSILNVLLRPDRLLVAVDTLAEDALTGEKSSGAKLLLIPQHNLVLATRGSTQFFLKLYELTLQASFRRDFSMEQLGRELAPVIDQLWPAYEKAAADAGISAKVWGTELVFGGWSTQAERLVATAYAKHDSKTKTLVQPLQGGLASPGEPLQGRADSFEPHSVLQASRLQAEWLNKAAGRQVAGGRAIAATLVRGRSSIQDLGEL